MMATISHPTERELLAFVQGNIDGTIATSIENHLSECPACCKRLGEFNEDYFVEMLKPVNSTLKKLCDTADVVNRLPTISGYEILREIGRGGMGVVYEARHLRLQRLVALKLVLGGNLASLNDLVRLRTEAAAAANLEHQNIIQIHEIGDFEGRPFLAFEFVSDGTLDDLTRNTPQAPHDATRLVILLARAMSHAHKRGIVHRDLKPANILIKFSNPLIKTLGQADPKIADFGLAKWQGHEHGLTATNIVAGTPSYMAPEQARGQMAQAGPAVDIYALGAILYELLTGRPPFKGETPIDTLSMVVGNDPVPPRQLQPRTPRDLETICLKCLHKDPARRYESSQELAEELQRWLEGEPIFARPVSEFERMCRWARKRPTTSSLLLSLFLVTFIGIAGIVWQWRSAEKQRERAEENADEARHAQAKSQQALDVAERQIYLTRIARARLDWLHRHDVQNTEGLLEQCKPTPGTKDWRRWEWYHLSKEVKGQRLVLSGHRGDFVTDVCFSPQGNQIASVGHNPFRVLAGTQRLVEGFLWDSSKGNRQAALRLSANLVYKVAYSRDEKHIVTASQDGIRIWDRQSIEVPPVFIEHKRRITTLALSPDSKIILSGDLSGVVTMHELISGQLLKQWRISESYSVKCVAYSDDGSHWAACTRQDKELLWLIRKGLSDHPQEARCPLVFPDGQVCFSPNLKLLAVVDGSIHIVDTETGKLRQGFSGHEGDVLALQFHPHDPILASGGSDRTIRLWHLQTGQEIQLLRGHAGKVSSIGFDNTGKRLVSGGMQPPEVMAWELDNSPGQILIRIPKSIRNAEAISFDISSQRLAALYPGGAFIQKNTANNNITTLQAELSQVWQAPAKIAALVATPDGFILTGISSSNPHLVKVWSVEGEKITLIASLPKHEGDVYQVALSADGKRIATAAIDRKRHTVFREIIVWNVEQGEMLARFTPVAARVDRLQGGIALSADGALLAFDDYSAGTDQPTIQVIELDTKAVRWKFAGHRSTIASLAFSTDIARLASGDTADQLRLWDLTSGQAITASLRGPTYSLAFSPDSQRLAAVDRNEVKLWDAFNGQEILTLRGQVPGGGDPGFNPCLAWSPDGKRLAASNYDVTLTVWESE